MIPLMMSLHRFAHAQRRSGARLAYAAAVAASLLAGAMPLASLHGQSGSCQTNSSCTFSFSQVTFVRIPVLAEVTASTNSFSLVPSGGITVADMVRGFAEPDAPLTVVVQTNATSGSSPNAARLRWNINSAAWSASCPFTLSDLTFARTSGGSRSAVPTSGSDLLTSLRSSTALASRTATLFFRVTVGWGDAPTASACTLPLQFTLSLS